MEDGRPDGIETIYIARWRNPRKGEGPLVKIYGRIRPMTKSELAKHFARQIEEAIARRNQVSWKFAGQKEGPASHEGQTCGRETVGGALVMTAQEMSLNAAGLARQDPVETVGGPLAAMAEVWARNAAGA